MKRIPRVHIILFILTVITTLLAGALQKGINPLKEPFRIWEGIPFSASLILILLSHELSHFFTSRAHRTEATLPYFIPAPTIIGTFGAVIKMRSPILSRSALVDIGASGPIVGFLFSLVASAVGLFYSDVIATPEAGLGIALGDSAVFLGLSKLVVGNIPQGYDVVLHPVAFAGWIGLFVTSLNLIPVGQLDGGHIAFAFLGRWHRYVSAGLVVILAVLGLIYWEGWLVWAALLIILGIKHPPVYYWEVPLDPRRKWLGLLALLIFLATFTPAPFKIF